MSISLLISSSVSKNSTSSLSGLFEELLDLFNTMPVLTIQTTQILTAEMRKFSLLVLISFRCADYGPGSGSVLILELISLLLMCGLEWVATLCLICSEKKGMPKFRYLQEKEEDEKNVVEHKKSCLCICCCPAKICRYTQK